MKKRDVLKGLMLAGAAALTSIALSFDAMAAELNVGANIGNVPWEFQDASGKTVGFEVDLMTEVAKRLGMDVKFTNIPFQGLFAAVQSGQIDAAVSSITITKKRLESVSFTGRVTCRVGWRDGGGEPKQHTPELSLGLGTKLYQTHGGGAVPGKPRALKFSALTKASIASTGLFSSIQSSDALGRSEARKR